MLIERIAIFVTLFAVIKNAEEISNKTISQEATSGPKTVENRPCCIIGNRSFHTMDSALYSFTNNATIKIIELKVVLNSKIFLENLNNVSIVGHKTPTVNCNWIGALRISSCNNVIIKGIIWKNCGYNNKLSYPGLSFYKSSNITIQNCKFYSSMLALFFSGATGNVLINHCDFLHNNQHTGHGAAIQYTTEATTPTMTRLVINRCNFSYNGAAKSIVYISGSGNYHFSCLENSTFIGNKGVPLHLSQQKLRIKGDVLFKHNTGISGGGIFSRSSVIVLKNTSSIIFYNNSANANGGAMFLNNSRVLLRENSVILFVNNFAKLFGGALYSINKSAMIFDGNTTVTFQSNKAGECGGAVYFENYSNVSFHDTSIITFNDNRAKYGGSIFSLNHSKTSFRQNSKVNLLTMKLNIEGPCQLEYTH